MEVLEGASLESGWRVKLQEAERLLHGVELSPERRAETVDSLLEGQCFSKARSCEQTEVRGWIRESFTESDTGRLQRLGAAAPSTSSSSQAPEPRPQVASPDSRLAELLSKVGSFDVDTVAISERAEGRPLTLLLHHVLQKSELCQQLPVDAAGDLSELQHRLLAFFALVDDHYRPDVIYHNNVHAADVMLMMHWFFNTGYMRCSMNRFDHLVGLIAAAVHDVGHDGFSNQFHVKTRSALALRYNDRSVQENMHVALCFELMRQHERADWFTLLSTQFQSDPAEKPVDLQQYLRRALVSMVLMTDVTKHDHLMLQIQSAANSIQEADSDSALVDPLNKRPTSLDLQVTGILDKKLLVLEVMLHAADISNPARPESFMLDWTRRIVTEFWSMGDEERRLGLPISQLCDRSSGMTSVPAGQIAFISYVVQPLFLQLALLVPEGREATEGLEQTLAFWQRKKEEGATFEDLYPDS